MKVKQAISLLFIGLVLTNLVHNIIPHHHHNDNILSHEGCKDQCCDIADMGPGDFCTHCHAFNDMQYFPVTENTKVISRKHFGNDFLSLPSAVTDLDPGMSQSLFAFAELPGHFMGLDRREPSLRAPPPIC